MAIDVVGWLCKYANDNNVKSFVVGVSGGIDSAVSSTLAAKTGLPVYAIGMPLNQSLDQETLSDSHLYWLECNYPNVKRLKADLSCRLPLSHPHDDNGFQECFLESFS